MASVAVPLIASFVVQKVGESQGWDPRFTAVASMAAGFGAGSLVSAGTAVAASGSAGAMGGAGTFSNGVGANAARVMTGAQIAQPGVTPTFANWGASQAAEPAFTLASTPTGLPVKVLNSNYQAPFDPIKAASTKASFMEVPASVSPSAGQWTPMVRNPKLTMGEAMGNEIDNWTKDPVDPVTGEPTGKLSAAKNFGVSALKTLMKPLPEEAPVRSGGGGGGGRQAPAYQGGGQSAPYQTVWSFGQPNQGYKPQGI